MAKQKYLIVSLLEVKEALNKYMNNIFYNEVQKSVLGYFVAFD